MIESENLPLGPNGEDEPARDFLSGYGDWDAVDQAVQELIASNGFDFDALQQQDETDLQQAEDHLK